LATGLLPSPPNLNPQDPYYGNDNFMVEEIPLRWKVEEIVVVANEDREEDWPQLYANRLMEGHLQLIFEIQKK
jgi:hypothetical protein